MHTQQKLHTKVLVLDKGFCIDICICITLLYFNFTLLNKLNNTNKIKNKYLTFSSHLLIISISQAMTMSYRYARAVVENAPSLTYDPLMHIRYYRGDGIFSYRLAEDLDDASVCDWTAAFYAFAPPHRDFEFYSDNDKALPVTIHWPGPADAETEMYDNSGYGILGISSPGRLEVVVVGPISAIQKAAEKYWNFEAALHDALAAIEYLRSCTLENYAEDSDWSLAHPLQYKHRHHREVFDPEYSREMRTQNAMGNQSALQQLRDLYNTALKIPAPQSQAQAQAQVLHSQISPFLRSPLPRPRPPSSPFWFVEDATPDNVSVHSADSAPVDLCSVLAGAVTHYCITITNAYRPPKKNSACSPQICIPVLVAQLRNGKPVPGTHTYYGTLDLPSDCPIASILVPLARAPPDEPSPRSTVSGTLNISFSDLDHTPGSCDLRPLSQFIHSTALPASFEQLRASPPPSPLPPPPKAYSQNYKGGKLDSRAARRAKPHPHRRSKRPRTTRFTSWTVSDRSAAPNPEEIAASASPTLAPRHSSIKEKMLAMKSLLDDVLWELSK